MCYGILMCCSFLPIEKNKELNKLLGQANRKAAKMEQQLQKTKVNNCCCYFPSAEMRMSNTVFFTISLHVYYKAKKSVQSYHRH